MIEDKTLEKLAEYFSETHTELIPLKLKWTNSDLDLCVTLGAKSGFIAGYKQAKKDIDKTQK